MIDPKNEVVNKDQRQREKKRRVLRKSTLIILLGVAIMTALTMLIVGNNPSMKESVEASRPVARETFIQLFPMQKNSDGQFQALSKEKTNGNKSSIRAGVKLYFNLSSNVPVHVAIAAAMNNKSPIVLFENARIPPAENNRLGKGGERFRFITKAEQGEIKFCIIQGSDSAELTAKLNRLKNVWLRLPEIQCSQVMVE